MSDLPDEVATGQAAAKRLWESLPEGTPVFVRFLGGDPRPARRTRHGWESGDGMTGCTPWSVRVDEVWVPAAEVAAERQRLHDRIEALAKRPPWAGAYRNRYQDGWSDAVEAARALVSEASASSPVSDDTGGTKP